MSFREKSAWVSLISMSGIYALYFWSVVRPGAHVGHVHFSGLLDAVIALVVVQTVLMITVSAYAPKEAKAPRDERDKLIDAKATRFAYFVLAGSVACACFFGGFNPPVVFNANALLFILVVAEVLRSGFQIVEYRRSA